MKTRVHALALALALTGCTSGVQHQPTLSPDVPRTPPEMRFHEVGGTTLGEPLALSVDFAGNIVVADGVSARVVRISPGGDKALEFQSPASGFGFYPVDVEATGFFIYALDAVGRTVVRFDKTGFYRDVLISFDERFGGERTSPTSLDVDDSGRIAVTDDKNHQVVLFDSYLEIELIFGSYGSYPGQLDSPSGISFTTAGELLVTDSGNRRVQLFDGGGTFGKVVPADGTANPMRNPRRAVMDPRGVVYVADPEAGAVFVFDGDGALKRSIVPAGVDRFVPTDVEVDVSGLIYVTDTANSSLYAFR